MAKNTKTSPEQIKPQPQAGADAPLGSATKPALAPTPEVENTDGKSEAEKNKKNTKGSEESGFETNKPVEFRVEKELFKGTSFSFPEDVLEDRKRIVREAYGQGIIKGEEVTQ